jgi:tetratricopeptide (TPR) repeat protein
VSTFPAGWNEHAAYLASERAHLLYTEGHFQESLVLFEGLMEIYPDNLYYRDAVSALYLSLGNPQEVIRHASRIIALMPGYANAFLRRGEAYLLLGMHAEAEGDLQRLKGLGAFGAARRMEMRLMTVRRKQTAPSRQRFSKLVTKATSAQPYAVEKR